MVGERSDEFLIVHTGRRFGPPVKSLIDIQTESVRVTSFFAPELATIKY